MRTIDKSRISPARVLHSRRSDERKLDIGGTFPGECLAFGYLESHLEGFVHALFPLVAGLAVTLEVLYDHVTEVLEFVGSEVGGEVWTADEVLVEGDFGFEP